MNLAATKVKKVKNEKKLKKIDTEKIEKAVREILLAVGEDVDRDGLKNTPAVSPGCMASFSPECAKTQTHFTGSSPKIMMK